MKNGDFEWDYIHEKCTREGIFVERVILLELFGDMAKVKEVLTHKEKWVEIRNLRKSIVSYAIETDKRHLLGDVKRGGKRF